MAKRVWDLKCAVSFDLYAAQDGFLEVKIYDVLYITFL